MTWRPLVEDEAEQARVRGLAGAILAGAAAPVGADHLADRAIARAYLGEDDGDELTLAIGELLAGRVGPPLHGGAAKVGFAVAHLTEGPDSEQVGASIETSLAGLLDRDGWLDYDLISGLAGFGVLALERGDAGVGFATRVLDRLERTARPHRGGLAWLTPVDVLPEWQRAHAPRGYWNLGLAHGIAGVIGLLARYLAAGIEPARTRRLLDGAVAHLLSAVRPGAGPRFPSWIAEGDDALPPGRPVAWCYGDLGIAVALLGAAQATGDERWHAEALATAHAAARCPLDDAGVTDVPLCHGAAGAAHLFNRLHQASGDAELGAAARRWLDDALARHAAAPVTDAAFLTGADGIALALHAACTDVDPAWDRLLLA